MSKEKKIVFLPYNAAMGGGAYYELVPFAPNSDHPEQKGCYILKPIDKKPNFKEMTRAELIEYLEEQE